MINQCKAHKAIKQELGLKALALEPGLSSYQTLLQLHTVKAHKATLLLVPLPCHILPICCGNLKAHKAMKQEMDLKAPALEPLCLCFQILLLLMNVSLQMKAHKAQKWELDLKTLCLGL